MSTAVPQVIELPKLRFVTQEQGRIKTETVKIDMPTPCKQSNAPGSLRSFDSFKLFCDDGRTLGGKFRAALDATRK